MEIDLLVETYRSVGLRLGFLGSILSFAAPIIGGLIGASSSRSTNRANQQISAATNETSIASAREANRLTERLSGRAIASTEGMAERANALTRDLSGRAIAQAKDQFEQSQRFNERMSNTAYTRGVKDLRSAGLNPILAATRGVTSTPSVSGGPTASGTGTGGSGTGGTGQKAQLIAFQKENYIMQGLNSAMAIGRAEQDLRRMKLENDARGKYGKGDQADFLETLDKAGADMIPGLLSKHLGALGLGRGKVKTTNPNARPTIGVHKNKQFNPKKPVVPLWQTPFMQELRRKYRAWKRNPLNEKGKR